MSLVIRRSRSGKKVSALSVSTEIPISAEEGVNGEDVAKFGPSTTHGYDPGSGALRMMTYARRTFKPQFFKAQSVAAGATVNSSENWEVEDFSKIRIFAATTAQGAGNIDVVLRVSINGGYNYTDVQTFSMGDTGKTVLSQIVELGATHIKLALINKSASTQNIDVWGLLY